MRRWRAPGWWRVIEPPSGSASRAPISAAYVDYLSTIVGFEQFRAGQFGIRHYCTIGLNPKEANNQALAEAVMEVLPHFAVKDSVVAIGEIGYDEQTALEDKYLRAQIELAKELELPIMIHTPHRDKKRGTTAHHGRALPSTASIHALRRSTTTTRRPCARSSTAVISPASRSIRTPRWAMSG